MAEMQIMQHYKNGMPFFIFGIPMSDALVCRFIAPCSLFLICGQLFQPWKSSPGSPASMCNRMSSGRFCIEQECEDGVADVRRKAKQAIAVWNVGTSGFDVGLTCAVWSPCRARSSCRHWRRKAMDFLSKTFRSTARTTARRSVPARR